MENKKNGRISSFLKKNKKVIYITVGILGGLVLCFFGVKLYLRQPSLKKFLEGSSLKLIKEKRDEIHNEYMSYTRNDNYRNDLWNLISVLDQEIRKRENNGKVPSGPAYHREHAGIYKPE